MAKFCPETNSYVLYLDCLECETKSCKNNDINKERKKEEKVDENSLPNRNNML